LGRYLLFRIAGHNANDNRPETLDHKILLIHITDIIDRKMSSLKEAESEDIYRFLLDMKRTRIFPSKVERMINYLSFEASLSNHANRIETEALYRNKYNEFLSEIQKKPKPDFVLDLYGGLAGIGLYILGELDKQHKSWMQLL
jgi:hypothetical protein